MRTKTLAKPRRSVSATTRPLPSSSPEHSSNDSIDNMEMDISSEYDGKQSVSDSECSDDEIADTCLKCNQSGQLLICSGTGCAICVHDRCIPSKPEFDQDGNFYCPYCWYKIHKAKAEELKKVVFLAQKALRDFMNSKLAEVVDEEAKQNGQKTVGDDANNGSVMREENSCEHLNKMDVDDEVSNGTRNVEKKHQNDENEKLSEDVQRTVAAEPEKIPETHEFEVLDDEERIEQEKGSGQVGVEHPAEILRDEELKETSDRQCAKDKPIVDCGVAGHGSPELKSKTLEVSEGNQSREEVQEVIHKDAPREDGSTGDDVADESIPLRQRRDKHRTNFSTDSKNTPSSYPHSAEGGGSRIKKPSPLKESARPQDPARKVKNLSFFHDKRRRMAWRPEEERMLREGVQKFSCKVNKNVPWRKILEFGRHVFDGTRTPADLKGKWRNIMAKGS